MGYCVDNAVILAAGTASRFAPLSYQTHKALLKVRGEILIERQIGQLLEAGITNIIIVVGYKKEQFLYLRDKYGVLLIENPEYDTRNNHSSIYVARAFLNNSFVCCADNYFSRNPFEKEVDDSYYAAVFAQGQTNEWCLETDENDWITKVSIGGFRKWYMLGHTFWSKDFSQKYIQILENEYFLASTRGKLWENIYLEHIYSLKMKIRRYGENEIYEFDSLDDLKAFDNSYKQNEI